MKPTQKVPHLELDLINDTQWSMAKQDPEKYTLILFYRGYHCPVCKKQLESLKDKLTDFVDRGVNVIAISMDTEERAKKTGDEWDIESIPVGYNLTKEQAQEWGLYLSEGISEKEPELFSEPGLFLIKKDGTLYGSTVQTMPFARPQLDDLLNAIDFIEDKGYPARGGA
ncbi:alkyl hydroperoxide reductase [Nonlabens sp. YIK11]|uniref:peroxiredoxin-like family protein n=1 Tax=Nonlabens sp. YIK11 TaxID=1453349 RepID=UPI0006DC5E78|nr:peroxiredoxin-like family protein [Nonlabens sp. YIK11]KQC32601.1 alkyl hydroperoxide reductase [Nonlabens sp. YIK11]